MASVVDTSVKHFTSDSAPMVLNGTPGSGIALLKACLVTGYGLMTAVSLEVAGGVATATFASPHAAREHQVVEVAGITGSLAAMNGEQKATARAGNTLSWATDAPDGTATGTITVKVAGAGWEELYSKTNVSVFRSLSPERHGQVLRVDDTAAQVMRVVGYESMSDVDTGVNPFPTAAQVSGGGSIWKSSVASAAANKWVLYADSRLFYLGVAHYSSASSTALGALSVMVSAFGDGVVANPAGDVHATLLSCMTATSVSNAPTPSGSVPIATNNGMFVARNESGAVLSENAYRRAYSGSSNQCSGVDTWLGTAASSLDGRLRTSRIFFASGVTSTPRADLPGLLYVPMSSTFGLASIGDTADGMGDFSGRVLSALPVAFGSSGTSTTAGSSNVGLLFVDITGPWR